MSRVPLVKWTEIQSFIMKAEFLMILPIASAIQDYYCVVKSQIGKLYRWIKADQVQNAQLPFYNSAVWFLLIGSLSERKKFNAC